MARNIGMFPSLKMEGEIWYQSTLERDYIYLLEFDKDVISYVEQPGTIYATIAGKARRYQPDFKVYKTDEVSLVEVKPSRRLAAERTRIQLAIGTEYCKEHCLNFQVITEEIREGCFLDNVKMLFRYSHEKLSLYDMDKIFNSLMVTGLISIGQLCKELDGVIAKNRCLNLIYHMAWKHLLEVDLTIPVTKETIIIGGEYID